ncbi:MAG: hypothetical protein KME06_22410 [Kastovskya adunca ATA6-11-RM4]|jgi:hypothetical protein|nr:hypothetical protein [Kastovskya adunca ATA6-11-RM4]
MSRKQIPNSNSQFAQMLHHLSQMSQGSTENTTLVIAYMSLLSFFATGIFGLLAALIAPRSLPSSPAVLPPLQEDSRPQKNLEQSYKEVRQIALKLDNKNVFPSEGRVSELTTKRGDLRNKKV